MGRRSTLFWLAGLALVAAAGSFAAGTAGAGVPANHETPAHVEHQNGAVDEVQGGAAAVEHGEAEPVAGHHEATQDPAEHDAEHTAAHAVQPHDEHAVSHDAEHHDEAHSTIPHLKNWVALIAGGMKDAHGQPTQAARLLERFVNPIFSLVGVLVLVLVTARLYLRRSADPGRLQMAIELIFGGLYSLFQAIIGPSARRYTPYLGSLFLFIWINNLMGLVPLMHSSTSAFNTTFSLAICTFCLVQGVALKENGVLGYLHHMAGSPRSGLEWGFSVLLFPLHLLGEFIKPISLSLRLFGNIFGEDTLIATMVILGTGLLAGIGLPFGIPLQFPFLFLGLLTCTVQALVFTLLSTVYIALMLPHHEHAEQEEHEGSAHTAGTAGGGHGNEAHAH